MVFFNHATRQMTIKIVYYGPGLCGKTTNLNTIYAKTSQKARGEMVSLNTETDRTLFFDLLPMDIGVVGGFKAKLQLYTVPGQVFYNSTRKLVLKGVDGIVFVADSQQPMLDANKESLQNLDVNLKELGLDLRQIPLVFQWNKRDLRNIVPLEQMEAELNPGHQLSFQSIASDGTGVFETLRGVTRIALAHIKFQHFGDTGVNEPAALPRAPEPTEKFPAESLERDDLPSFSAVLDEMPSHPEVQDAVEVVSEPDPVSQTSLPLPSVSTPNPSMALPANAPAMLKLKPLAVPKPTVMPKPVAMPVVSPVLVPTTLPKAKTPTPKTAVAALLAEMTQTNIFAGPAVLKINLPEEVDQDLEIAVLVRKDGRVVAQGLMLRPAPMAGNTTKLSVEIRKG